MTKRGCTRRRFLRAVAAGSAAALAGCPGGSDGGTDTSADGPTADRTPEPASPTPTPADRTPTATATEQEMEFTVETSVPPERASELLAEAAIPVETTDPMGPLDPLDPLADSLGDARIVGMGEATHGTREFFLLKHRILRFMVEELGCRLFAWEANFSETLAIDEYVRTGEGDPEAALDGIYFWTWNTESVLAMIEWIRSFNEGRDPGDKVRFYGFDVQFAQGPARRLRDYLERVDEAALDEHGATLATLAEEGLRDDEDEVVDQRVDAAMTTASDLQDRFESERDSYVAETSADEYALARRHLWTLDKASEVTGADDRTAGAEMRDEGMAANIAWILEHEDADSAALWAHNGHISATRSFPYDQMGWHLREEFGDAYYPLGFQFAKGRLRARDSSDGDLRTFSVDDPPDYSLPGVLSAIGQSPLAVDFRSVEDPDLAEWLDRSQSLYSIGAVFDENYGWAQASHEPILARSFDGLVFVEESTPTRLLED